MCFHFNAFAMKNHLLSGIMIALTISCCPAIQAQEFNELELERISPTDSAGIYNISGWISDSNTADSQYHLYLKDRFGNIYLQKPSCSIMRDSVFNHYNIVILPYNNLDIVTLHMFSIESSERKALRRLDKVTTAGIPEEKFRQNFPEANFQYEFYRIVHN